jgi:uncharacterized membrane protein (DUF373 family)
VLEGEDRVVDALVERIGKPRAIRICRSCIALRSSGPKIKTGASDSRDGRDRPVGVADAAVVLYQGVLLPSIEDLRAREIVAIFGAFLAVLIAMEIFMNIALYLRDDVAHVRPVIATALKAIARKVIVFDFEKIGLLYLRSSAAVVLALGVVYALMDPRTTWGAGNRQR